MKSQENNIDSSYDKKFQIRINLNLYQSFKNFCNVKGLKPNLVVEIFMKKLLNPETTQETLALIMKE